MRGGRGCWVGWRYEGRERIYPVKMRRGGRGGGIERETEGGRDRMGPLKGRREGRGKGVEEGKEHKRVESGRKFGGKKGRRV